MTRNGNSWKVSSQPPKNLSSLLSQWTNVANSNGSTSNFRVLMVFEEPRCVEDFQKKTQPQNSELPSVDFHSPDSIDPDVFRRWQLVRSFHILAQSQLQVRVMYSFVCLRTILTLPLIFHYASHTTLGESCTELNDWTYHITRFSTSICRCSSTLSMSVYPNPTPQLPSIPQTSHSGHLSLNPTSYVSTTNHPSPFVVNAHLPPTLLKVYIAPPIVYVFSRTCTKLMANQAARLISSVVTFPWTWDTPRFATPVPALYSMALSYPNQPSFTAYQPRPLFEPMGRTSCAQFLNYS